MVKLEHEDIRTRDVLDWKGVHIFHYIMSSCSQKLRIFLALKKIVWTSHEVDLIANANITPWFLGINPRGLVPVLVHDGDVHIESNDILLYLEKLFPIPCLIPAASEGEMARLLRHEDELHLDFRALSFRFVFNPPATPKTPEILARYAEDGSGTVHGAADEGKAREIRFWKNYAMEGVTDEMVRCATKKFKDSFDELEGKLAGHAFLESDTLTLLDVAWFIYVNRMILAGYPLARLHPRLAAWFEALQAKPEFSAQAMLPMGLKIQLDKTRAEQKANFQTLVDITGL